MTPEQRSEISAVLNKYDPSLAECFRDSEPVRISAAINEFSKRLQLAATVGEYKARGLLDKPDDKPDDKVDIDRVLGAIAMQSVSVSQLPEGTLTFMACSDKSCQQLINAVLKIAKEAMVERIQREAKANDIPT